MTLEGAVTALWGWAGILIAVAIAALTGAGNLFRASRKREGVDARRGDRRVLAILGSIGVLTLTASIVLAVLGSFDDGSPTASASGSPTSPQRSDPESSASVVAPTSPTTPAGSTDGAGLPTPKSSPTSPKEKDGSCSHVGSGSSEYWTCTLYSHEGVLFNQGNLRWQNIDGDYIFQPYDGKVYWYRHRGDISAGTEEACRAQTAIWDDIYFTDLNGRACKIEQWGAASFVEVLDSGHAEDAVDPFIRVKVYFVALA